MKAVSLIASPRKEGNGTILINKVNEGIIEQGGENEIININDININGCQACDNCGLDVDCVQEDDFLNVINKISEADVLIFDAPIYFGQICGQGKSFLDRFYSILRNPSKDLRKKTVLFFTYGSPQGTFTEYCGTIGGIFERAGFEVQETVDVGDIQPAGSVNDRPEILKKAKDIGANL